MTLEDEEIPIVDLTITPPVYDIDNSSSYVTLVYKKVQGTVWIAKNEEEEVVRKRITKHFSGLINEETERVAGIYYERYGPIFPLDVIIRLPSAWSSDSYNLYVVPRTPRIDKIVSGELIPKPPIFDLDSLYLTFGDEKKAIGRKLTSIFRSYGFIRCVLPDRFWNVYKNARSLIEKFFEFPTATKNNYSGFDDTGYVPNKIRREIFHVHQCLFLGQRQYLPDDIVPGFGDAIKNLYDAAKDILLNILLLVLTSVGYPASYIYQLVDEGYEPYDYATSMRLFQYNPVKEGAKWSHTLQCFEHADTTLFTFSPCTIPAEVEMVDRASGTWQIAEKDATEREVLIFPGVYLAWLTAGHIQAPLHRVRHFSKDKRISTPFFMRCPKDAILDRSYLHESIAPTAPRSSLSITQFLRSRNDNLEAMANEKRPYIPKADNDDDDASN